MEGVYLLGRGRGLRRVRGDEGRRGREQRTKGWVAMYGLHRSRYYNWGLPQAEDIKGLGGEERGVDGYTL